MPRTARAIEAGMVYHVLNRGNGRMRLFHKPGDYQAFEQVLSEGLQRYPVELLTYAILPNLGTSSCAPGRTRPWAAGWAGWG
jgi:putative transposase